MCIYIHIYIYIYIYICIYMYVIRGLGDEGAVDELLESGQRLAAQLHLDVEVRAEVPALHICIQQ